MSIENTNLSCEDYMRQVIGLSFGLTKNQVDTVEFILWLEYYIERSLSDVLLRILNGGNTTGDKSFEKFYENIVDELYFMGKINVFKNAHQEPLEEPKKLIKYMRKINEIRNHVFHGRIKGLKYNGKDLTLPETKKEIYSDFKKALDDAVANLPPTPEK